MQYPHCRNQIPPEVPVSISSNMFSPGLFVFESDLGHIISVLGTGTGQVNFSRSTNMYSKPIQGSYHNHRLAKNVRRIDLMECYSTILSHYNHFNTSLNIGLCGTLAVISIFEWSLQASEHHL